MKESTKKIISMKDKIIKALELKDPSEMTVTELDEFAKAVASTSSITAETMSDIVDRLSKDKFHSSTVNINKDNETINDKRTELYNINNLSDTVDLMNSDNYKDRLKAEYWQTKIRLESLEKTIKDMKNSLTPKTLPSYNLLVEQSIYMKNYVNILYRRALQEDIPLFQQNCCCSCLSEIDKFNYNFPFNIQDYLY